MAETEPTNSTNNTSSGSTLSIDLSTLNSLAEGPGTAQQICKEVSQVFRLQPSEVALLKLEKGLLRFLSPPELASVGSIPESSSTAVAAHTASLRQGELFNTFTRVKHASIFETVPLKNRDDNPSGGRLPIQKLMSCPIFGDGDQVIGVIQVSRKGLDEAQAGPDFSLEDLQHLEQISKVLARASCFR